MTSHAYIPGCPICLEPFNSTDEIIALTCGHVFCAPCMKDYARLFRASGCSLCTKPFGNKLQKIFVQFVLDDRVPKTTDRAEESLRNSYLTLSLTRSYASFDPDVWMAMAILVLPSLLNTNAELRLLILLISSILSVFLLIVRSASRKVDQVNEVNEVKQAHTRHVLAEAERRRFAEAHFQERLQMAEARAEERISAVRDSLNAQLRLTQLHRDILEGRLSEQMIKAASTDEVIASLRELIHGLEHELDEERCVAYTLKQTTESRLGIMKRHVTQKTKTIFSLQRELTEEQNAVRDVQVEVTRLRNCTHALLDILKRRSNHTYDIALDLITFEPLNTTIREWQKCEVQDYEALLDEVGLSNACSALLLFEMQGHEDVLAERTLEEIGILRGKIVQQREEIRRLEREIDEGNDPIGAIRTAYEFERLKTLGVDVLLPVHESNEGEDDNILDEELDIDFE